MLAVMGQTTEARWTLKGTCPGDFHLPTLSIISFHRSLRRWELVLPGFRLFCVASFAFLTLTCLTFNSSAILSRLSLPMLNCLYPISTVRDRPDQQRQAALGDVPVLGLDLNLGSVLQILHLSCNCL